MYKEIIRPIVFALSKDPEIAHHALLSTLEQVQRSKFALGALERMTSVQDSALAQEFFGLPFPVPVGLAAGFDKNGKAPLVWPALGFGFAELGTVTKHKQEGNPRPRIFRLTKDGALINRMGFNNQGVDAMVDQLFRFNRKRKMTLFGSVGKSKITPLDQAVQDYCYSVTQLYPYVDVTVTNVSSPNTEGLRKLQGKEELDMLLGALKGTTASIAEKWREKRKPLLVKIAPDLSWEAIDDVLQVCSDKGVDGLIAVNTTLSRQGLKTVTNENGGLSGKPLAKRAREIVRYIRQRMGKDFFLIGVGGISSPEDAYAMLCSGANLIQLYTGLIYEGPLLPARINKGLLELMERDGIKHISELRHFWSNTNRQLSA